LIDYVRGWADENDAFLFATGGKCGVFCEESVARMDRFGAAFFCHLDDAIDDEIALRGGRWADGIGIVRIFYMKRFSVCG
jgi:hypothetical protein